MNYVHYRLHNSPSIVRFKNQIIPIHILPTGLFISIPVSPSHRRLGLPSGIFLSGFPTTTLHAPLISPMRATCPYHFILLDFITRIVLGKKNRSWSSTQCNFLQSPAASSLSAPKILVLFPTPCSRKSVTYVSPSMREIQPSRLHIACW